MVLFIQLRRLLAVHLAKPRWYIVLMVVAIYGLSSWLLLFLCGETELTQGVDFFYWLVVTASTVGYGDLSPTTAAGKWAVALFIIPVGLSLFALVIGRLATYAAIRWRKGIKGLGTVNLQGHILVLGWNGTRTLHLLKLLLREQEFHPNPSDVVLCVASELENPLPGRIAFVKVTSFTDDEEMSRASIGSAKCIILDNERDDVTMTTSLYCNSRNPEAHIIAYFRDEKLAPLLTRHCPNIECTPSVAVEMMAKAAVDPGSSYLHHQLLDVDVGMTQYSVRYPIDQKPKPVGVFFNQFKQRHQATLIGIANRRAAPIELNPAVDKLVEPGALIYYIADERIATIDWSVFDV